MNTALKLDEPTPLSEVAAANIRAFAGLRGLTQMDFVKTLGMSYGVINKRWRGVIPWTVDELGTVAHILDVEVFDLIRPIEAAGGYAKPRRGLTPAGSAARSKGLEPPTF